MPDLILCDVQMPDMDGYEVLKQVREDEGLVRVPFVFLTGLDDMKHLRQGMNLGADDYLTKPFSYADLSQAVTMRLEKHKALTEQYEAELREAEEKAVSAESALLSDDITGLPNRRALDERFLSRVHALGETAVMVCGFDKFAEFGQNRPEALVKVLLKGAATRLRAMFPDEDSLYSVERNSFVLLLPSGPGQLPLKAQTIIGKLNDPYKIMGQELTLCASLGLAQFPADGESLAPLLRKAEAARHKAEAAGGNQHRFAE
jgi:PleD family two-component response regulator